MPSSKRKLNADDVPEPATDSPSRSPTATTVPPKATFRSLNLDTRLVQAIAREKFATPTAVQTKAIPLALQGKHVLARAKTGGGKTLAYLLPTLHHILRRKLDAGHVKQTTALVLVPTKELAAQVTTTVQACAAFCAQEVRCENITRKEDLAVTTARLATMPDLVVATPKRANYWINQEMLKVGKLKHIIIDEADLVLSYDYKEDLQNIAAVLPSAVQKIMMSATLRAEVDTLVELFFAGPDGSEPMVLDLSAEEATERSTLAQYTVATAEDEKFLLIYAVFKLQLIKGKVIVFVADIDRCYRVKLFLEQFGIRSCVLNSELPVNSRAHVVEEFNKNVYDIIIAADESEVIGSGDSKKKRRTSVQEAADKDAGDDAEDDAEDDADDDADDDAEDANVAKAGNELSRPSKRRRKPNLDAEYGVSRGIDFRHVTCVLNFDLPTTVKAYTHRVGRTARAGQSGMALSLYVPKQLYRKHKPTSITQCEYDEEVLTRITKEQAYRGSEIKEWGLDWCKLDGFRYRLVDALRAVTRIAVREARTRELRNELIKSEKLRRHFEENPEDLRHLRHDTESHAVRQQPHLKHIPDYLLPSGGKTAMSKDVGFVGIRKDKENRIRKARAFTKSRGNSRAAARRSLDPLKSLNARGRSKK